MAAHVFLSHVTEDADFVERLRADLQAHGADPWVARERLKAGDRWMPQIRQAIRDGSFFIACYSSAYLTKKRNVMNQEILLAIDELQRRPRNQRWFIPIKLTPCEIPEDEIGGGQTLHSIQYVEMFPDWDRGMRQVLEALDRSPSGSGSRFRLSARSWILALLTVLLTAVYGLLVARSWPDVTTSSTDTAVSTESDDAALEFLHEGLAHIKADRIEDAYHAVVSAENAARTIAVKNRAAALRVFLTISLSEAHQMMGETLITGQKNAREQDKLRYAELAVGQSMQSFKWAKIATQALDTLSSRRLPEIRFSKVELSNSLGERMTAGIEASQRIKDGQFPSNSDIDRVMMMLASQTFRFNVTKAFNPQADRVSVMTRDHWDGAIQWSPDLASTVSQHVLKMADKGIDMTIAIRSRPDKDRFDVGRSFGLGEELNLDFCRGLLESQRRFVEVIRTRAASAQDGIALNALLNEIDQRLTKIADNKGDAS